MIYEVKVIPGAKKDEVLVEDSRITIRTTKHPTGGEANQAVIKLLSKHFHTGKGNIIIKKGLTSRHKLIEIMI